MKGQFFNIFFCVLLYFYLTSKKYWRKVGLFPFIVWAKPFDNNNEENTVKISGMELCTRKNLTKFSVFNHEQENLEEKQTVVKKNEDGLAQVSRVFSWIFPVWSVTDLPPPSQFCCLKCNNSVWWWCFSWKKLKERSVLTKSL